MARKTFFNRTVRADSRRVGFGAYPGQAGAAGPAAGDDDSVLGYIPGSPTMITNAFSWSMFRIILASSAWSGSLPVARLP